MTPVMPNRPVYLDNQATTRCDPRVLAAMLPWFTDDYGNPHSHDHGMGRRAEAAVERARAETAALVGADAREIVFTSGATESSNIAIKGAAHHARRMGSPRRRIVTTAIEHKCVLQCVADVAEYGFEPVILPVGRDGLVEPDRLAAALAEPTLLVSIMAVNNEIGVVQDIRRLAALCREAGALFHTDAPQAVGKVPVRADALGRRSAVDQRPQNLRTKGHRRALRAASAARAPRPRVLWGRPGTRLAAWHVADAAHRGARRGEPDRRL